MTTKAWRVVLATFDQAVVLGFDDYEEAMAAARARVCTEGACESTEVLDRAGRVVWSNDDDYSATFEQRHSVADEGEGSFVWAEYTGWRLKAGAGAEPQA